MKRLICIFLDDILIKDFSKLVPEVMNLYRTQTIKNKILKFFKTDLRLNDTLNIQNNQVKGKKYKRSQSEDKICGDLKYNGPFSFYFRQYFDIERSSHLKKFKKEHRKYKIFLQKVNEISLILMISKIIKNRSQNGKQENSDLFLT